MYRQGDVLIRPVAEIPATAQAVPVDDRGRVVLAYGEATGHAHALPGMKVLMFHDAALARTFIDVREPTALTHEEHGAIPLPPGRYEVIRQREYAPEEIRQVAD